MSTFSKLISSGNVAIDVRNITGSNKDAGVAAGYSTWIESVTGSPVTVVDMGDGRAKLILTQEQANIMTAYFEKILLAPPNPDKTLLVEMGPIYNPLIIKYAVPAVIAIFALGYFSRTFFK